MGGMHEELVPGPHEDGLRKPEEEGLCSGERSLHVCRHELCKQVGSKAS